MNDFRLVYTTDPTANKKCGKCKNLISECECTFEEVLPEVISAKIRIEKKGRGGKIVTVIYDLPRVEKFLKDLTKTIKQALGCGGTFEITENYGLIEVQGEKKDEVKDLLIKKGLIVKG